jgi:hypothetical protein
VLLDLTATGTFRRDGVLQMGRSDYVEMPELQDKSIRSIKMVQMDTMMEPAENFVLRRANHWKPIPDDELRRARK